MACITARRRKDNATRQEPQKHPWIRYIKPIAVLSKQTSKVKTMLRKHWTKLILAIVVILNSGCTQFANTKLPLPVEPEYPKVSRQQLQCLAPQAYKDLVKRDVLKSNHIRKLENVIRSTH